MAVVKVKGIPYDFGGRVLVIPPLSLGAMEQLQGRLADLDESSISPEYIGTVIDAVHAALQRNYPEMKREDVAGMIDLENMQEVMACTMDVAGLKRKAIEAAQAGAQGGTAPGE